MCYSATAIANYFIQDAIDNDRVMTNLRLQKLIYFAHATYFKQYGELLINDQIEAWPFGPVIPNVYFKLKKYQYREIDDIIVEDNGRYFKIKDNDTEVKEHLNKIIDVFKNVPTVKIVALSQQEDGAWYKTLNEKNINPNDKDLVNKIPRHLTILDNDIKDCGK